jgi:pilus assembly protein CpaB
VRKAGLIFVIIVALISGFAASALAYYYLKNQTTAVEIEMRPVVVVTKDLTFGEALEAEDMKIVMYPEGSVPKGAYSVKDSLLGEITKVFLKENEPVLESKLSSKGGGLSLLINPEMRAASIQVDKVSGVSGFILPGDKVDVIATVDNYGKGRDAVANTILQNTEVLAAGEKTEQKGDKVITVQAVTLLVTPEGAQSLALASQEAKLHLALRNPIDAGLVEVSPISKAGILASNKKKEEEPKPKVIYKYRDRPVEPTVEKVEEKPDSVVIIRGKNKETEAPAIKNEAPGENKGQ